MKISVYFILYIAMIMELLIFIVDRDDAEEELIGITTSLTDSLINNYSKPLELNAPQVIHSTVFIGRDQIGYADTTKVTISAYDIWGTEEAKSIEYFYFLDSSEKQPMQKYKLKKDRFGNGIYENKFTEKDIDKVYKIKVYAVSKRIVPDYFPDKIKKIIEDGLRNKIANRSLNVDSDTVSIRINITGSKICRPA